MDYGCGVGVLAEFCRPDSYVGIDIDKESVEIARKSYPQFHFECEMSENEQFDTIVGLAVIEHVSGPVDLLARFGLILKPHGRIVLTTPHPFFKWLDCLGSKIGLLSPDKDEHEQFITLSKT